MLASDEAVCASLYRFSDSMSSSLVAANSCLNALRHPASRTLIPRLFKLGGDLHDNCEIIGIKMGQKSSFTLIIRSSSRSVLGTGNV